MLEGEPTIAALFTMPGSVYESLAGVDCWGVERDARTYAGPWPVVAHPPCARWGRYWSDPLHPGVKYKGDDGGCFAAAIWAVRTFGGILEHPANSHAWPWFGLRQPPRIGAWVSAGDDYGGATCCVEQYLYGHRAQKATWLYACKTGLPRLRWGKSPVGTGIRLEDGLHADERRRKIKTGACQRLSHRERAATPREFAEVLLVIARTVALEQQRGEMVQCLRT